MASLMRRCKAELILASLIKPTPGCRSQARLRRSSTCWEMRMSVAAFCSSNFREYRKRFSASFRAGDHSIVSACGEVSRTGSERRTPPTGVSVAIVHRATPPGSRRMLSTPASISLKVVRSEKNSLILSRGALMSSSVLNEELTRNIWKLEVRSQRSEVRRLIVHARVVEPELSSYQQWVHQRCVPFRSSRE